MIAFNPSPAVDLGFSAEALRWLSSPARSTTEILKKLLQFRNSILLDGAKQKLSGKTSVDLNSHETGSAVPNPQVSVLLMSNKYNRLGPAQMEGLPRSVQQLCWQPASWHLTFWRSPSPRMETAPQKK